jgi:hypothetical protein
VRFVAARLGAEVNLTVAPRRWRLVRTIFRPEALHAGLGFDHGAVNGEMIVQQQRVDLRSTKIAARKRHAISPSSRRFGEYGDVPPPAIWDYAGPTRRSAVGTSVITPCPSPLHIHVWREIRIRHRIARIASGCSGAVEVIDTTGSPVIGF